MTDADSQDTVQREAERWFARLRSGPASEEDKRAFKDWLAAAPENARAFAALEQMWRDLEHAAQAAGLDSAVSQARPASGAWSWLAARIGWRADWRPLRPAVLMAGVAAAVVVLVATQTLMQPPPPVAYATQVAEVRDITLDDGSVVTLGARSRMEARFTGRERRVTLLTGVAYFDVAPQAARPFVVMAGQTRVRVAGTQFDVKRAPRAVHVAVREGLVAVVRTADGDGGPDDAPTADRRMLAAGQRVVAPAGAPLSDVLAADLEVLGAWRTGQLSYENARLGEIVADMNRHSDRPIRLTAPELADIRLTTAFRTSEIDAVLDVLAASQPIEVIRSDWGPVLLRPKPATH